MIGAASERKHDTMNLEQLKQQLNAPTADERLAALKEIKARTDAGEFPTPEDGGYVNNHIHTIYSFSPYSPTAAVYTAWVNGLTTAGSMDHDSIAAAREFIAAGEIVGMSTTVGFECRVDFSKTPFNGRRLNNPDQKSVAYVALHGIPHQNIDRVEQFLAPMREKRNIRNRAMTANINRLLDGTGVSLDFDRDIEPISENAHGGSITERHILFALSKKVTAQYGKGAAVLEFLQEKLHITPAAKQTAQLSDADNPHYEYDLLGVLKAAMVEQFYIDATEECPDVTDFIALAREVGGIAAYAYLGDVGNSVTGDKKPQKFEDDYLDDLIPALAQMGFMAVTYMPTRNTPEQLRYLGELCRKNNLFEISGEDINSPRQAFKNDMVISPEYRHLVTATWALIGHEKAATENLSAGMFSDETVARWRQVADRIPHFAAIGHGE